MPHIHLLLFSSY